MAESKIDLPEYPSFRFEPDTPEVGTYIDSDWWLRDDDGNYRPLAYWAAKRREREATAAAS